MQTFCFLVNFFNIEDTSVQGAEDIRDFDADDALQDAALMGCTRSKIMSALTFDNNSVSR